MVNLLTNCHKLSIHLRPALDLYAIPIPCFAMPTQLDSLSVTSDPFWHVCLSHSPAIIVLYNRLRHNSQYCNVNHHKSSRHCNSITHSHPHCASPATETASRSEITRKHVIRPIIIGRKFKLSTYERTILIDRPDWDGCWDLRSSPELLRLQYSCLVLLCCLPVDGKRKNLSTFPISRS